MLVTIQAAEIDWTHLTLNQEKIGSGFAATVRLTIKVKHPAEGHKGFVFLRSLRSRS